MFNRKFIAEQVPTGVERSLKKGNKPQKIENYWSKQILVDAPKK